MPRGGFAGLEIKTSGPAVETQIAIDGGKPAFRVDPTTTPLLGLRLAQPGSHTVTATTIGANGAASSASSSVLIKPGSSETRRPAYFPDVAVATTTPRLLTSVLGTQTAADKACVPDSTVFFGAVEATGCFKKVESVDDIPAPERAAASEFLSTNILIENAHVLRPCKLSEPSCHGDAEAALAKDPNLKPFVSTQPVLVNGMTIAPRPGSSIVVFPAISRVISHDARISYDGSVFGSIPVKTGPLNMDVSSNIKRFTNGDAEVPLFSFDTSQAFKDIGGFPINGSVQVVFKKVGENRSTALVVDLALPDEISTAAQADPTAKVEVKADNQRGTYLGFLNIHIDEAFLGPVELANVDFTYDDAGEPAQNCPRKWWKATAEVFFIPVDPDQNGAGLIMAPEPQRNGVAFCAGAFHSAGAALEFGYPLLPPPQIFPGVFLNRVAFDFQLKNPTLFDGSATIKSAEIVTATGGFLTAFATPAHPYTFKAGDAGGALKLLAGQKFESTTVALGGTVSIEPEDDVEMELGSAYLLYNYPDYISARGSAHIQTLVFAVNAEGAFEMSTRTRRFNAFARGEVCLAGGIKVAHVGLCAAGEGRISSRGASVCFDLIDGNWTPGVGYLYGDLVPEFFFGAVGDGCKPSHFWEEDVRAARISAARPGVEARPAKRAASASAAGGLSFEVKRGETSKTVELTGAGGAPAVTVRAPNGEAITSVANELLHGKHLNVVAADKYGTTWVGVENGKPGTYRVDLQPGSATIAKIAATRPEPGAGVKGSVTGKGRHLVLNYDAGHAKGQKVTFLERGKGIWKPLRTVSGGKGTIAFRPSFGPRGRRTIAAQVEVDGIPATPQTLDHFKAPPPPRAGRVKHLRVRRHKNKLVASWRKVPLARSYSVVVEQRGGAVRSLRLKAKRHAARVGHVSAVEGGRVEVVAFGPLGDRGRPAKARFKATRKAKSRLLRFKELGTAAPFDKPAKKGKGKH